MQIERRTIEANLPTKGFIVKDTHHKYFYHEYNGKRTGVYTYTSRGNHYKSYGVSLIKMMKKFLFLDSNRQVADLCNCPISKDDYNQILRNKGKISF